MFLSFLVCICLSAPAEGARRTVWPWSCCCRLPAEDICLVTFTWQSPWQHCTPGTTTPPPPPPGCNILNIELITSHWHHTVITTHLTITNIQPRVQFRREAEIEIQESVSESFLRRFLTLMIPVTKECIELRLS